MGRLKYPMGIDSGRIIIYIDHYFKPFNLDKFIFDNLYDLLNYRTTFCLYWNYIQHDDLNTIVSDMLPPKMLS